MKRVIDIMLACLFVVATCVLMFAFGRIVFGKIFAYMILGFQVITGLWMLYKYISAPMINEIEKIDDVKERK